MKVALLTVADSTGTGGQAGLCSSMLHKLVVEGGRTVVRAEEISDDRKEIAEWLRRAADKYQVDLVLTSGSTGLGARNVTPEATRDVLHLEVPGIAEAVRAAGIAVDPRTMLSRGVAGVRLRTLIINLSGSPKVVTRQWAEVEPVVDDAVETLRAATAVRPAMRPGRPMRKPPSAPPVSRPKPPMPSADKMGTLVGQPLSAIVEMDGKSGGGDKK